MKIVILLNQPYPKGYALTKRMQLYAKGFIKNGHSAKFIIPAPVDKCGQGRNSLSEGVFEGVPFEYAWPSCERSKNFITRRFHDIYGPLKSGVMLIKEKPKVVIAPSFSTWYFLYIKLISLLASFKFLAEKCEVDYLNKESINALQKIKLKVIDSLFDGIIVINPQLENYHRNDLQLHSPMIKVPILVEDYVHGDSLAVEKTVLYTGTYLERKDGILTIITAFKLFSADFPDFKLVLTGSPERSSDYHRIIDLIKQEKIEDKVIFTGYLSEKELHNKILCAGLLIIAKPANRQNYYNFPTKIGEYLISGRPILSTKVGVVGEILSDDWNVFFDRCDSVALAKRMKSIIKDKRHANEVGKHGREYALNNFDYTYHTHKMLDFFDSL